MDYQKFLAGRTQNIKASVIREILKVVSQPGMISLAGGLPSPDSFPLEIIDELSSLVIKKYGSKAFQYSATEGFPALREALAAYLNKKEIRATADDVCITSGSQGLLDGIGKVFISEGQKIAVEAPTYVGALQAFNSYGPEYVCIKTDDNGVIPEHLEDIIKLFGIKLVYLVPTFQNPTGRTLPLDRRYKIADIIQKYEVLLIEDDPYSDLRYRGKPITPLKALAPDNVIYTGTVSKILAPGFRIGFYVAPPELKTWLIRAKQGVDLHTSTFTQAIAAEYLAGGFLDKQIKKIIALYQPKQEAILEALDQHFPKNFTWSKPDGGMFIWVEGPKGFDAEACYHKAIEQKVAYVPGKYFFTGPDEGLETMRLNFSMCDADTIRKGIRILGDVIRTFS
ncbi:PLP-dependent aminotransferase family protein [bacterium]|nr:PLP-dependent aminotransferase family protein [bacterium]MBU1065227.1 PLP-dependent aminotransferase family protein [bacterium]MBU1634714.1 PLP-dependent aminotransferase family protein [bacterium]MBU1873829.1 PLP-dependent aminotransferase family protein [bacterium]